mgnify:CR=1 FL=1
MPILYALVKSTNGDVDAAYENINEGKITWNTKTSENPKVISFVKRHTEEMFRIRKKANGYNHTRKISVNDKPEDSGSDTESRKSFEKVNISETPTESNDEAKDLSINSFLNRERFMYDGKNLISPEEYQRYLKNSKVNFDNVSSLSIPHVKMPTLPFFMYADKEMQTEYNINLFRLCSARYWLQYGNIP